MSGPARGPGAGPLAPLLAVLAVLAVLAALATAAAGPPGSTSIGPVFVAVFHPDASILPPRGPAAGRMPLKLDLAPGQELPVEKQAIRFEARWNPPAFNSSSLLDAAGVSALRVWTQHFSPGVDPALSASSHHPTGVYAELELAPGAAPRDLLQDQTAGHAARVISQALFTPRDSPSIGRLWCSPGGLLVDSPANATVAQTMPFGPEGAQRPAIPAMCLPCEVALEQVASRARFWQRADPASTTMRIHIPFCVSNTEHAVRRLISPFYGVEGGSLLGVHHPEKVSITARVARGLDAESVTSQLEISVSGTIAPEQSVALAGTQLFIGQHDPADAHRIHMHQVTKSDTRWSMAGEPAFQLDLPSRYASTLGMATGLTACTGMALTGAGSHRKIEYSMEIFPNEHASSLTLRCPRGAALIIQQHLSQDLIVDPHEVTHLMNHPPEDGQARLLSARVFGGLRELEAPAIHSAPGMVQLAVPLLAGRPFRASAAPGEDPHPAAVGYPLTLRFSLPVHGRYPPLVPGVAGDGGADLVLAPVWGPTSASLICQGLGAEGDTPSGDLVLPVSVQRCSGSMAPRPGAVTMTPPLEASTSQPLALPAARAVRASFWALPAGRAGDADRIRRWTELTGLAGALAIVLAVAGRRFFRRG
ncbi:hypothetical protein H696_04252 [Fonticula alba]|uniref:Arrestin-like N-terminal domain-containing protein n=1 Tax=Fonticula alba TaxID=691883 RepID=A0A058Z3G5_FONAL|nr:hypothetical protein H696_04252 [Fonticula alba]KCV68834.1 hypothetical protein H696_04252 [Fonticula alba]|eukprot:XP_009496405.1 hypothetical protein H696_04252 [Fonticula alba]